MLVLLGDELLLAIGLSDSSPRLEVHVRRSCVIARLGQVGISHANHSSAVSGLEHTRRNLLVAWPEMLDSSVERLACW